MKKSEGFQSLQQSLSGLPQWASERILQQINQLTHYEPVIGIMGKTGAGKSSLCNALFAGEVSPVSDVNACTREPLRFRLNMGERCITLVDLPGVGESQSRDAEYANLYREQLPRLEARSDIFDYIEMFYNSKRRHGSSNQMSPTEYENQYYQRLGSV